MQFMFYFIHPFNITWSFVVLHNYCGEEFQRGGLGREDINKQVVIIYPRSILTVVMTPVGDLLLHNVANNLP